MSTLVRSSHVCELSRLPSTSFMFVCSCSTRRFRSARGTATEAVLTATRWTRSIVCY